MTDNTKKPLDDYIPKDFGADTPRDNTKEDELRELFRKIIRDYYNKTFEYAMEQLQKGDISAVIANAESKQRALDDPYLDEIESVIQAAYISRAEHRKLIEKAEELLKIQGDHGNWDYDPYMHGMYNGMEVILATIKGTEPRFKDAPDVWVSDMKPSDLDGPQGLAESPKQLSDKEAS